MVMHSSPFRRTQQPVVVPSLPVSPSCSEILYWLETSDGFHAVKSAFDSTSRFARLKKVEVSMFGRQLFARFVASTGDAMGMNMVSKVRQGWTAGGRHVYIIIASLMERNMDSVRCVGRRGCPLFC